MKNSIIILTLLISLSPLLAGEKVFRFTAIPDQDNIALTQRFGKIATYLSKELGVKVEYVPVKSYSASIAAFNNDEVQLAWFGGLSGVKARRFNKGAIAIAQGAEDTAFITYFIANSKAGLLYSDSLSTKLMGKTFTFGSKGSTSGRLMPEYYLRKQFLKAPEKIFKKVGFSGNHVKTISLVQSGAYEVGAVNFKVWQRKLKEGLIDTTKVSVIWKTPTYPDYNWTIRGDVNSVYGKGFIEKVQNALINMTDPKLLNAFPRTAFIKADNSIYGPILKTGTDIGIFDE